jgi:nucleotide-binding universal stress UspA family protein
MKILAALDPTKKGGPILEKAVELAKLQKAELIVMVVAENLFDAGDIAPIGEISDKLASAAKSAAAEYEAKAKALGLSPQVVVEQSPSPADSIIKTAEARKVDMVVLGSRSKTGLDRFLLGSVANKVVAHAPCSVLVYRPVAGK